ncbi:hypothetical protein IFM89_028738 [Coptis chinensis]|uniref:Uncharacterized protein n=1 Tax=Coptis chinensis TaxID=261450 RepID=A0A835H1G8_9MAGN|nr:hypothetical protein IFM89_028738 [Coptis chinensis]
MANPRRSSYSNTLPLTNTSETTSQQQVSQTPSHFTTSFIHFLKRPHAFPFLLSIFLLLAWLLFRFQHLNNNNHFTAYHSNGINKWEKANDDENANVRRLNSDGVLSRDKRGWMFNPVVAANDAGLYGVAVSCASVHVGQIRPGGVRGNHRHHTCNETFLIWGAETKFRLENPRVAKGYAEVYIGAEEVTVSSSPRGTAHALVNVDSLRTTYFIGCQDSIITYNSSNTDFKVWKDL